MEMNMKTAIPLSVAVVCVTVLAAGAAAQDGPAAGAATQVVVAGPRYAAGPLHRFFLGTDYRKTWTAPVRVEVLDLARFAGGLTPTEKGGGKQTVSLAFKAPDGRDFRFRSVDKDPSATLPEELRDTAAEWLVQDQIRASYPVASVVVDGMAEAAGLLYVPHAVYVLPDDPRLGQFRQEFKGRLGILEENPDPDAPLPPGFEGATKIIETEDLVKLLDADPGQRVDERAYLKARLFDILVGDWDRHQGQWEWVARPGRDWLPFATDRDMAFADYDGLMLSVARASHPVLVVFEREYPRIAGLAWNSREVDRRFLGGVERAAFQEAAGELQRELTDDVIVRAVHRLPPEYLRLDGGYLSDTLKARRDRLPAAAAEFYELLAREAEVHLTDAAEVVDLDRSERGDSVEVRVSTDGRPTFRRRFLETETGEVRIYARGGDDRLVSRGTGAAGIQVRFVGGPGDDTVDDSRGGRTHFFDHQGQNQLREGPGTKESNKPYEHPKDRRGYLMLDWGSRGQVLPYLSAGGEIGVLAGAQVEWVDYGFRKHPWASRQRLRAGYAFGARGFRAEYDGQWQHTNSRKRQGLFAHASNIEIVRFFGFGNETGAEGTTDFYRSEHRQFLLQPSFRFGLDKVDWWVGPRVQFQQTEPGADTFLGVSRPYGVGDFGQVGLNTRFAIDGRNRPVGATTGARLGLEANYYPKAWSVDEDFGEAHGELSAHLYLLHLRVGGKKVWGRFPFHEAAFLGGPDTVRALRRQRYAGDAAVFGNAELRLPVARFTVLLPIRFGVLALADAGRVWLEGESSEKWHKGFGAGAWLSFLKPENTISITAAKDPDATGLDSGVRVYFQAGFAF
jgi:hypothetical protein